MIKYTVRMQIRMQMKFKNTGKKTAIIQCRSKCS